MATHLWAAPDDDIAVTAGWRDTPSTPRAGREMMSWRDFLLSHN